MQDFINNVGRKLRALFKCAPTIASPSNSKTLKGSPAARPNGMKTIDDSESSADTTAVSQATSQQNSPRAADIPLPESPTIDDLVAKTRAASVDHSGLQQDEAGPHIQAPEEADKSTQTEVHIENSDEDESHDLQQDDSIEWTPEQAQAVREANYIQFDSEDEDDYTRGPARMVEAADGVANCTALLVTIDLSKAIQKAVKAQRDYYVAKKAANNKTEALLRFTSTLDAQIASHRSRLTTPDLEEAKRTALEAELSTLGLMIEEYKMEHTAIQNNLEFKGDMLRKTQAKANAMLEEAWTDAQLLEPEAVQEETPVPEYDLQTEFQAFQRKLKEADESPLLEDDTPLDTSKDHLRTEMTAEEKEKTDEADRINRVVWDAWERLEDAQADFDRRDDARVEAEQVRHSAIQQGQHPVEDSSEAFDIRWHQHERELTQELIDAEDAYRAAQQVAADAGVSQGYYLDSDAESEDEEYDLEDGYASSSEDEVIATAPINRIMQWLSNVPQADDAQALDVLEGVSNSQADEWEVADLGFGDSVSQFCDAEFDASRNPHHAKVLKWREHQQNLAAEFGAEGGGTNNASGV